MAIDGGGGGGGILGFSNSFTGSAQALEIYGDFAAAYTGVIACTTSEQTVLSFTTGNYLFVGRFQLNAALQLSTRSVVQSAANITFNGVQVALLITGNSSADSPFSQAEAFIIPAYTEIVITVVSDADDVDKLATAGLTGRIYRE